MMRLMLGILFGMVIVASMAQDAQIASPRVEVPSEVVQVRSELRTAIFGSDATPFPNAPTIDTQYEGHCCYGNPEWFYGRSPVSTVWIVPRWGYGGGLYGMLERMHFSRFENATCLLLYNSGHGASYFPNGYPTVVSSNVISFIRRMVNEQHCDVILQSMPLQGENGNVATYMGYNSHDTLGTTAASAPPSGGRLRYFLEGGIASISYAIQQHGPYNKIVVAGLSGGGWTTTLLAAIDPRITHSYAVAGSIPIGYRLPTEGDWEQVAAIKSLNIDYQELYLMGTIDAAGNPTRKARLFYNQNDPCCFPASRVVGWAQWVKPYVQAYSFGPLNIYIDPSANVHDVLPTHADVILQDVE